MPQHNPPLLEDHQLERSPVVANNRMNRERKLHGINSYEKEIGFDVRAHLLACAQAGVPVRWIDICCGQGNALIQAAQSLAATSAWPLIQLEGIDLVGMFAPTPTDWGAQLQLHEGSVAHWRPTVHYDLITCIHGIHYLGDKLGFIRKAVAHLKENGLFIANFDPNNFCDPQGAPLTPWWNRKGWQYNARRHLLQVQGNLPWLGNWEYLGANDAAGPNYSGQPAVNSFYRMIDPA